MALGCLSGCGSAAGCTLGNTILGEPGDDGTIIIANDSHTGRPGIIIGVDISSPFFGSEDNRADIRPRDYETFDVPADFYDVTLHWAGGRVTQHTIGIGDQECATIHARG